MEGDFAVACNLNLLKVFQFAARIKVQKLELMFSAFHLLFFTEEVLTPFLEVEIFSISLSL